MSFAPRRAFALAAAPAAAVALAAGTSAAQAPINPIGFGISAGAAVPSGDFADDVNTGFSVDGVITLRVPASPVSLRGEVGYTRFGIKDDLLDPGVSGNQRILSGVANLVFGLSAGPTAVVRPYLIGGVGIYNGRASFSGGGQNVDTESESKFGLNGGVGIEIPLSGLTGFGEVRYTSVFTEGTNTNFIPIRFGIRF